VRVLEDSRQGTHEFLLETREYSCVMQLCHTNGRVSCLSFLYKQHILGFFLHNELTICVPKISTRTHVNAFISALHNTKNYSVSLLKGNRIHSGRVIGLTELHVAGYLFTCDRIDEQTSIPEWLNSKYTYNVGLPLPVPSNHQSI
jgi:hypothetical protein